jgi:hypothetical protein
MVGLVAVAGLGATALGGCGGNFDAVDRVVSLDASQVCLTSSRGASGGLRQCADPAAVGRPEGLTVGACVEVRHAGESARILRVTRVVACPTGTTVTTT